MKCMFDFLNGPYLAPRCTCNPIIIKSGNMIHIHIKHVHVEFHRRNKVFKPIIFYKHILNLAAIMIQP